MSVKFGDAGDQMTRQIDLDIAESLVRMVEYVVDEAKRNSSSSEIIESLETALIQMRFDLRDARLNGSIRVRKSQ